jgi:hypothetical protein
LINKDLEKSKTKTISAEVLTTYNAILSGSDEEMKAFASQHCGYTHDKGLDFVARFNGKYVIGEAKFLTDFGGHQNAQFNDALQTLNTSVSANVVVVAILDGVLYIPSKNKLHRSLEHYDTHRTILSALVLREFLYQV